MKKVKVQDAVGLTLCHDITAMRDGFKGAAFKRGHVIEEGDVEKLLDLGKRTVFIWEETRAKFTRRTPHGAWLRWRRSRAPLYRAVRRERSC